MWLPPHAIGSVTAAVRESAAPPGEGKLRDRPGLRCLGAPRERYRFAARRVAIRWIHSSRWRRVMPFIDATPSFEPATMGPT